MARVTLDAFDRVVVPLVAAATLVAVVLETLAPLRRRREPRTRRWRANATVGIVAGVTVRAAVLPAMIAVAGRVGDRGRGLLGGSSRPIGVLVGVLLLDHAMYLWHRANHRSPPLWRFHAAHHTDPDLDVSTAFRFHFGELLFSLPVRCAQVALFGIPSSVVLAYEGLLQAAAALHHSNTRLPASLDRSLARVFVTPVIHGLHHSVEPRELHSSWGVVLSIWDRLYGTLSCDPSRDVVIGVPDLSATVDARSVLAQPFRSLS